MAHCLTLLERSEDKGQATHEAAGPSDVAQPKALSNNLLHRSEIATTMRASHKSRVGWSLLEPESE